jgi:hypothetical protein
MVADVFRPHSILAQLPKLIYPKILLRIIADVWSYRFHQLNE